MTSSLLTLPTSDDVTAARGNIRGFAVRTPLLKLSADIPGASRPITCSHNVSRGFR